MSFNFSTPTRYQPGAVNTFAPSTPAPTAQPQPNVQNAIKGTTPYSQLDPVLRQRIEFLQKYMHEEKVVSEELAQHSTAQLTGVSEEADDISEKLQSLLGTLESDRQTALALKKEVVKELKNVEIAARTIERFNTPMATYNQNSQLPSKYFWDLVDSFNQRMVEYNQTIQMIEKYVSGAAERRVYTPQMLGEVLRNHVNAFLELSAEVAALHESVNELRQIWAQRKRAMGIVSEETESTAKKRDLGAAQLLAAWTALQAQNKPATTGTTATGSSMNLTMTPGMSTAQPSSGLSFAFGASQPSTGTSTFAFGTPTSGTGTTTATTPGFGTPTATTGSTSGTSFSFGSSSSTSSFSFGAPSGTTGTSTAAPATTSFSFGTPSTSTGAFTFGTAKK